MSQEFYQRKKFKEKKIIENPTQNEENLEKEINNSSEEKNNFVNSLKNEANKSNKKFCPKCGRYLDENHKTNLITEDEFNQLREKMDEPDSYIKILDTDTINFQIGEEIKEKLKKEFHISEDIKNYKQGHHLISKKDIFFKNKDLAIIALSAGYNINCIENGIVLPAISKTYIPDWNLEDKFRVMSSTKKQIHSGHHNFEMFLDSEVDSLTKEESRKIPKQNYSCLVTKEFQKTIKPFEEKCFFTESDKEKIKTSLNNLSKNIKKDIEKFSTDPKSCKFYVSKAALQYAFFLNEKTYKFIKINFFNKNSEVSAEKYKITLDYDSNEILLQKEADYSGNYNINFLKFCEDITFFLYDNRFYFLVENLDFNLFKESESINFKEIFSENKNIKHKFIEILEKYSKNKQSNIREIIMLRKRNI